MRGARSLTGFTLFEILIVIGILSVLLMLGLFMSLDSYQGFVRRSEGDTVVSIIERARSHALANIHETSWGVCYDDSAAQYITFRGTAYNATASTNEPMPASSGVVIAGFPLCSSGTGIVFEALTGSLVPQLSPATDEILITVIQNSKTSTININNEGRIDG